MRSLPGSLPGSQLSKNVWDSSSVQSGVSFSGAPPLQRWTAKSRGFLLVLPSLLLSPNPSSLCGLPDRGPSERSSRRPGVSGVHPPPHTVNVSNRSPLPRRRLLVAVRDPVAVKNPLVSHVSSLARLGKVAGRDERSCQDIITAGSASPNESLPTAGHEHRRHKFVSATRRASEVAAIIS